ncbi:MAG TPA: hypothetical protein VGB15_14960 [Longimicrobium sp.]|jgi:hypothetical protein
MRSLLRRPALGGLLAVLTAALTACSDSPSESKPALTVQISATTGPPTHTTLPGDPTPVLQCELVLSATATGAAKATAQWGDGKFRIFVGANRETAMDSFTIAAQEIHESWGVSTITAGDTQEARWILTGAVPFTIRAEVTYQVLGSSTMETARYEASCGHTAPASTSGPTVTNLRVSPTQGELVPGQLVDVSYTVNAPAGLWETVVILSGGATAEFRTREQFQTGAGERSRTVTVPANSNPGKPVMVSVRVADALLRVAVANAPGPYTLVDREAPVLMRVATRSPFNPRPNDMVGQYAPGDTITATWIGHDNNALVRVGWGLDAPGLAVRDSLLMNDPGAGPLRIPVRPEWVGANLMRVWLTDRAGLRTEMVSLADSIRVYPIRNRPTRTAQHTGHYREALLDPARRLLYLSLRERNEIAVLSLATMTYGTPIALPGPGAGMDLSISGDSLLVAIPAMNGLAVVDLKAAAGTAAALVNTGDFSPVAVRVAADGRVLAASLGSLAAVELRTGAVATLASESYAPYAALGRSPDRSRVVYGGGSCRFVYDAAARTVSPCSRLEGVGPFGMDDAGRVFSRGPWLHRPGEASAHLFANELALTGTSSPSPDGTEVFLSSVRGLLRASVDGRILDRMPFPHVYGSFLFADGGATLLAISSTGSEGTTVTAVELR